MLNAGLHIKPMHVSKGRSKFYIIDRYLQDLYVIGIVMSEGKLACVLAFERYPDFVISSGLVLSSLGYMAEE